MRLVQLHIQTRFKNIEDLKIDFRTKEGLTVLIGNNGSGKSNILEALSSIFAGLYDQAFNPSFRYFLIYEINGNEIKIVYNNTTQVYVLKSNNVVDNIKSEHLPSQVVASYSGEETRLWETYYSPFYQKYIQAIKGATLPNQDLIFINKYYWNIALLTFYFYDFEAFTDIKKFCETDLGITQVNSIKFDFDIQKIGTFQLNPVVNFVQQINPNNDTTLTLTLEELKERLAYISNEIDFFNYLTAASMPKDDKLITNIEFNFNNNLNASCFSEGEKKLILVKLILEVIGDENSLILLDEPDSHIHISRKQDLQKLLNNYASRENILTTHSPTLTHCFDNKHIIMLNKNANNDAEIENKEKQEIVNKLTNGIWSYQEQNIFLNTNKDILLVEGVSDETFISRALTVLKRTEPRYADLDFAFMPCGGASGIKLMMGKFSPKTGQTIIAFFDRDKAGVDGINKIFDRESNNGFSQSNFICQKKDDIWISFYPIRSHFRGSNFNVEDYFSKKLLNSYVFKNFRGLDSVTSKDRVKKNLDSDCKNGIIPDSEFRFFKKLFDEILIIKNK
jgi:predicted ATP-dependent endonuclease of OLD family